jgi:hypothetical protein
MNTLVIWNTGKQLSFYQIPDEMINAYWNIQGVAIGRDHTDRDETYHLIEHLAFMLGEEPFHGDAIPSLEEFMADPERFEEGEGQVKTKPSQKQRRQRRHKQAEPLWQRFCVPDTLEIQNCGRILHTGWFDASVAEREIDEQNLNKQMQGQPSGGRGQGGDGRGEVQDPAHDRRLKGNRENPPDNSKKR